MYGNIKEHVLTEGIVLYSLKIFNQHIQNFHLAFLYLKACLSQWELNDF